MPLRPKIQRRFDILEAKTLDLFDDLNGIPTEVLVRHPEPGYWNALEAINHIYLGEKLSLQYVRHKLTKPETISKSRPDAWIRTLALKWVLYSPFKFKSPPQINMRSDQPVLALPELKDAWKVLRADLRHILEQHEIPLRHKLPYKQPYAGRMTLNQMMVFFEDHLVHHTRQIRRIIKQVSV